MRIVMTWFFKSIMLNFIMWRGEVGHVLCAKVTCIWNPMSPGMLLTCTLDIIDVSHIIERL